MTANKETIMKYMDGFRKSDHQLILSCLTDDVYWEVPGAFQIKGKQDFDKEIENDAFVGSPVILIKRIIEENNVVIAEGAVQSKMTNGGLLDAVFCDVFEMEGGKIKALTSYLMNRIPVKTQ
jgi:uncharacterized protein